jgi:hypothetical protein
MYCKKEDKVTTDTTSDDCSGEGKMTINNNQCVCDIGGQLGGEKYVKTSKNDEPLECTAFSKIKLTEEDCWVSPYDPTVKASISTENDKGEIVTAYCKCPEGMFGDGLKGSGYLPNSQLTESQKEETQPTICNLAKYIVVTMNADGSYPEPYAYCNNYSKRDATTDKWEGTKNPRGCIPKCDDNEGWELKETN